MLIKVFFVSEWVRIMSYSITVLTEHNHDTIVPWSLNQSKLLVSYAISKLLQDWIRL